MKIKTIISTIAFLILFMIANAQPLPPSTPSGSPVPVECLIYILPAALTGLGIIKLSRKKK